jgi:uncharacterized protein (TIGR02246 family)
MLRHLMRVSLVWLAMLAAACAPPAPAAPAPASDAHARNDQATRQEIEAKIARLSRLLAARDRAIVAEFTTDPDTLLMGSEASERAIGREQLSAFFDELFTVPVQIAWEWKDTRISSLGDIAWVYADGNVVLSGSDGETRSPYRMTGVLERRDGQWRWRQFHGSEPAKPSPAPK